MCISNIANKYPFSLWDLIYNTVTTLHNNLQGCYNFVISTCAYVFGKKIVFIIHSKL